MRAFRSGLLVVLLFAAALVSGAAAASGTGVKFLAPFGRASIKDAIPKFESIWNGGTHHIMWTCDPNYFGTVARLELVSSGRFVMLLGYKFDCSTENDFEVAQPNVPTIGAYQIRLVSVWQELHPDLPYSAPVSLSPYFTIQNANPPQIMTPVGASWTSEADGSHTLVYSWDPLNMGTVSRVDLLQGTNVRTLAINYFTQTSNTLHIGGGPISDSSDYVLRITSVWGEEHSIPLLPVNIYSVILRITTQRQFYYSHVNVEDQPASPLELLRIGLVTDWRTYGSAYIVSLRSVNSSAGIFQDIGGIYGDEPTQEHSLWIPPLATDETAFYVITTSVWQELHPSVPTTPEDFTRIQSNPIYILNPRGTVFH